MPLLDRIQTDMVAAMKAKDEAPRLGAIRLIKQRRESADMFRRGNRPDLADKEGVELKLIEG